MPPEGFFQGAPYQIALAQGLRDPCWMQELFVDTVFCTEQEGKVNHKNGAYGCFLILLEPVARIPF
jgi:hypothetical protein